MKVEIIRRVPINDFQGSKRYEVYCSSCPNTLIVTAKAIRLNTTGPKCPSCMLEFKKWQIAEARKKKVPKPRPEFLVCKSCGEVKDTESGFYKGRLMCKKCSNTNRMVYYYRNTEEPDYGY